MDGFFGIGIGELLMIAIVALIVLGPERLPGAFREVAKFVRSVRNLSSEFTAQFGDEFKALEDLDPRRMLKDAIDSIDEEEDAKGKGASSTKSTAKSTTTKSTPTKSTTTNKPTTTKPAAKTTPKSTTKATEAKSAATARADKPATPTDSDVETPTATITKSTEPSSTQSDATDTDVTDTNVTDAVPSNGSEATEENQIAPPQLLNASPADGKETTTPTAQSNGQGVSNNPETANVVTGAGQDTGSAVGTEEAATAANSPSTNGTAHQVRGKPALGEHNPNQGNTAPPSVETLDTNATESATHSVTSKVVADEKDVVTAEDKENSA